MTKLAWAALPLALYAALLLLALLRGRLPGRRALNMQLSLLLMGYLLTTAGLGLFWVSRQQLPVFDWHYLFGYGTLALVAIHLWFNLPSVWRALRAPQRPAAAGGGWRTALPASLAALLLGYALGAWQRPAVPAAAETDESIAAVVRFHAQSSESRRGVFQRAPGIDWGNVPPAFKRYPAAPRLALQRGGVGGAGLSESMRSRAPRTGPLQVAELGDLLFLAAGVTQRRGGVALRAAPSSGALFPSELYVLARGVRGLAPGVYHYDPDRHALEALGRLAPAQAGAADADIVLTAVFRRTGYKYGDRAYRYVAADAGHLLENLRIAGHAAGLSAVLAPRFDETALARTLGVDGVEEGVLAVAELRRDEPAASASLSPSPIEPGALGVTGTVHQATSLRADEEPTELRIALPAPQDTTKPVRAAIEARRSQRRFGAGPVPLPVLAAILADMAQPPQLSDAVRIHVVASRVDGLAPGVYRYDPRHFLILVHAGDYAARAGAAALSQDAIGGAPVVLVLSADRARMFSQGARGYRHAFIEAGMTGERWLLGAVARGLAACPVGAFYDDEAAALIGADPRREWVLHFAALGWPAAG